MITDWQLYENARSGDENAWNKLVELYWKPLVTMSLLILGSVSESKDIAQETFIKLLKAKPPHKRGSFNAYITTIGYRLALKEKKRLQKFYTISTDSNYSDENPNPLSEVINEEKQHQLFRTINSLKQDHRDIIVLRFYGKMSYEEIAEAVNLPMGTVKSRIFYAVKTCRESFTKKGLI
jgi:RNA polymerase sigma-70 factor (ECF subfamily)